MKQVIGIDIGGTNFRIGSVSETGNLSYFEKKSSEKLNEQNAVEYLVDEIQSYIKRYQLDGKVLAVTIGVPSIVSKDKSFVYSTPNLKGLENVNLGHRLESKLGISVTVDRDVNYLLSYDIHTHRLDEKNEKTIVGMYIGTGLGNAISIDGKLYVGKNGAAGELGHIPLYGLEEMCACGNAGCVEIVCSGHTLQRLQKQYFPDTDISDIFVKHKDDPKIKQFIETLAIPISTEITILDPDYIVLGGGVLMMKEFPMNALVSNIKKCTRKPYPSNNLQFIFSEHTQSSGVLGGAYLKWKTLQNSNHYNRNKV